ncbi:MAG: M48 family metallopeptidase, partial [Candidatus Binatia bacterium]|nr:M48 family metallopeptidase [Candidatus Binatia bacterium]
ADRTARRMAPPMSIEEQRAVGSEMNRLVLSDTPKWNDQRETHRAEQVFAKLLHGMSKKEVTCSLTLLDSQAINAFATAGGYVYATRGILTRFKSEAQLAMILGHELGHIEKAHPSEQIRLVAAARRIAGTDIVMYAQIGYRFLNNSHTKADEFEADEFGFRLCRKLGYQRPSLISVLEGLIDIEKVPAGGRSGPGSELIENLEYFLRSHPYTEERRNRLLNLDI